MQDPNTSLISQIMSQMGLNIQVVSAMIIAGFTAMVVYLNKVKHGHTFRMFNFFVNIAVALVIAFGVSWVLRWYTGGMYSDSLEKGIMVFVGITANKILETVEEKGFTWFLNKIIKK